MKIIRTILFFVLAGIFLAPSIFAQTDPTAGMVSILAGSFQIGDAVDGETDAHVGTVTVSAFFVDSNLVTYGLWEQVFDYAITNGYIFDDLGTALGDDYPVQTINWYDAVIWCNARSQMAGLPLVYFTDPGFTQPYMMGDTTNIYVNWSADGYRLPTEAEWEKAARGGVTGQRFPLGNSISEAQANYSGDIFNPANNTGYSYDEGPSGGNSVWYTNSGLGTIGLGNTSVVGYFPPNGYGLYDMAGNVFEWCWDWYSNSYPAFPLTDPHGAASGTKRVDRGGDWSHFAYECRTAYRGSDLALVLDTKHGFRTVLPEAGYVSITVLANPTSEGFATGSPAVPVITNTIVTNIATASNGYQFTDWTTNGVVVSTDNPYIFPAAVAETLVANFAPTNYTITIQASPAAASSVDQESGAFQYLSPATFTAFANSGYVFSNWTLNGVPVTNTPSYSITVLSNETLVANFTQLTYIVSLSSADGSEGSVSGSGTFGAGDMVTNSATANSGFQFASWTSSGNVVSTASNYVYTITTNVTLVANFAPVQYTVTALPFPGAGGMVSGGGTVNAGTSLTNIASTNGGYQFVNWTVNGMVVSSSPTYIFTVMGNETLVANFTSTTSGDTVTLIAYPPIGGTVSGGGTFNTGTLATNIASTNGGYQFTDWTVNGFEVSTTPTYIFPVMSNVTLVANFGQTSSNFTVTTAASPLGGGTVVGGGTFLPGSLATNTATANTFYQFVNWTVNSNQVSASPTYIFAVSNSETLVANFALSTFNNSVSVSPILEGGATGAAANIAAGSLVTNLATPFSGYQFVNWTQGGIVVGTAPTYIFPITSNTISVANFAPIFYNVVLVSSPSTGGAVSGGGTAASGSLVTNTATASNGYAFVNWTTNSIQASASNPYIFTASANETLVANFVQSNFTVSVAASPSGGGTVSGGGTFLPGKIVTNSESPNALYQFNNWTVGGNSVSVSSTYTFTVSSNVSLVANFSLLNFTNAVSSSSGVEGSVSSSGSALPAGSVVTNVATPNAGYRFVDWTVGGAEVSTVTNYVFTLTSNQTSVANFAPLTYDVTVIAYPSLGGVAVGGGTISTGSLSTNTASTNGGYQFVDWTVNGSEVSTTPAYVFAVTTNVTLVANFQVSGSGSAVTIIPYPGAGGTVTGAGSGTFSTGVTVTNTAMANPGYQFVNWTVGTNVVNTSNTLAFTVLSNVTLVANFMSASNTLTVIPNPIAGGSANGSGIYALGAVITNTATASNGYLFLNWTTNGVQASTSASYIVTLTNDETLVANFENTNGSGTNVAGGTNLITVLSSPSTGSMANLGGTFLTGSTATVTVMPNAGFEFVNWTTNGIVASTSNTYAFTVNTNLTLVANFTNLPATYTLTATGAPELEGSVTGGGSFPAGATYSLTPVASNNFTFVAWTGDANGSAVPLTNKLTSDLNIIANFTPSGVNTLTVTSTAGGTVSPQVAGEIISPGQTVTVTATPAVGYMFAGWTGTTTSTQNPLTVSGGSSVVLQANFISDLFPTTKGSYNGLFVTGNGVTETTAGMLKGLTISAKNTFSGSILFAGGTYPISGTFSSSGSATKTINLKGGGTLTFTLQLANADGAAQLGGTVVGAVNGASWIATLTAYYSTTSSSSAQYTLLIPPDPTNMPPTRSPGGEGYLSITDSKGTIKLAGALADGTPVTQSTTVSDDGYVPVYASLYKNQGLLLGWLNLGSVNTNAGGLTWINPGSTLYSAGFTNVIPTNEVAPSLWTSLPGAITALTNLSLTDTITGPNAAAIAVSVSSTTGKFSGTSSSGSVTGLISPKTGLLTVTLGSGASKISGFGAVSVNGTNITGGGYFLNKTNTPAQAQAIRLAP